MKLYGISKRMLSICLILCVVLLNGLSVYAFNAGGLEVDTVYQGSAPLYSIVEKEGILYCSGNNGVILRSDDKGSTWTNLTQDSDSSLQEMFVSTDGSILAARAGQINNESYNMVSEDGYSFSLENNKNGRVSLITKADTYSIGYSSRYGLYFSEDSLNWSLLNRNVGSTPQAASVNDVTIVGGNLRIYRFTSKNVYTTIDNVFEEGLRDIASSGSMFVAADRRCGVYVSYDGQNWLQVINSYGTKDVIKSVLYTGNMFIVTFVSGRIDYSQDGYSWNSFNLDKEKVLSAIYIDNYLLVSTVNGNIYRVNFPEWLSGNSSYHFDNRIVVNNKELKTDVKPMMYLDRILVPLRVIIEALGGVVSWEDTTNTAMAVKGDTKMHINFNDSSIKINDKLLELDAKPMLINDRTVVPVRAIAEHFGFTVYWDENTKAVVIK